MLRSDLSSLGNSQNKLGYNFVGYFANLGLFVVQHNNPKLPLKFGMKLARFRVTAYAKAQYSCNHGDMVFSSNGMPSPHDDEILVDMTSRFINAGSLSVVGTAAHTAQMRIQLLKGRLNPPAFHNVGTIYVKNAIFYQEVPLSSQGCVAIDDGGIFYAHMASRSDGQRFHFYPGTSTLFIASAGAKDPQTYTVTTFPRGASVQVEAHMTRFEVFGNSVTFFPALGGPTVQVTFDFPRKLDAARFRFERGRLTYADDLLRSIPATRCENVHHARNKALEYEIKG